eukprot:259293-Chlamydomonas_euryale.AAC.2
MSDETGRASRCTHFVAHLVALYLILVDGGLHWDVQLDHRLHVAAVAAKTRPSPVACAPPPPQTFISSQLPPPPAALCLGRGLAPAVTTGGSCRAPDVRRLSALHTVLKRDVEV